MRLEDTGWELPGFLKNNDMTEDRDSTFYTCQVCGDNWLSVKDVDPSGKCQLTFIHQMGAEPQLKRVASMQTSVVINDGTVENWDYFSGEEQVDEDKWREQLYQRREILKSICCN